MQRCPTCGSRPKNTADAFWWAAWPCGLCPKVVCNVPIFYDKHDRFKSSPCYVHHMEKEHPEVYR